MKYLLFPLLTLLSAWCFADSPVSTGFFGNTAIEGKDTVAYHSEEVRTSHREMIGDKRFTVEWGGAQWRFASQASADKFAADPARYVPQYNGHCSNALTLGEGLIPTDGTVWEFFGGNLHLFFAERGRQRWLNGDWEEYKAEADRAWEVLKAE